MGFKSRVFEHRQMMNMMNYNYPYYRDLVGKPGIYQGCRISFQAILNHKDFNLPEKVRKAAEIAKKRGTFKVVEFKNKKELLSWAPKIGKAYNKAFVKNWEYYPLTQREIDFVVENIMTILDPTIFNVITREDEVVWVCVSIPGCLSRHAEKIKGNLRRGEYCSSLKRDQEDEMDLLQWGVGILPEYQGLGGNAIMYAELEKAMHRNPQFKHSELTQGWQKPPSRCVKTLKTLAYSFTKPTDVYQLDI